MNKTENNKEAKQTVISKAKRDALLLKRIAEADKDAFKTLFINYYPKLVKYCNQVLKNDIALSSEIAEDTLLTIWKTAHSYTGQSKPTTWIYSIARFKLKGYFRKYSKEVLKLDDASIAIAKVANVDRLPNIPNIVGNNESKNHLIGGQGRLSQNHQEILKLVYMKELSIMEVAHRLKVSKNTVKKRMFYAQKNLKTILLNNNLEKTCHNKVIL